MTMLISARGLLATLIFLLCNGLLTLMAQENSIAIDSNVDRSTIRIGDLIKYTIIVTRTPDVNVEMPGLAANLGSFEIRDYHVYDSESRKGQLIDRFEYTISTFDVGEFEIPPLEFSYTLSGDSTRHVIKTKSIKIMVESIVPSEAGDIRDIKSPLELPRNYNTIIMWISVAAGFVLLGLLGWYVWRRRKAGKGLLPERVEPPRPAHEVALEQLNALRESSLLEEGRVKEYYIEISEIIRRYMEGRYFIVALELTTFELIQNLRKANVEAGFIAMIQEFLEFCDLVKFAKYVPSQEESNASMSAAIEIVEQTKLTYDKAADTDADDSGNATEKSEETEIREPEQKVADQQAAVVENSEKQG